MNKCENEMKNEQTNQTTNQQPPTTTKQAITIEFSISKTKNPNWKIRRTESQPNLKIFQFLFVLSIHLYFGSKINQNWTNNWPTKQPNNRPQQQNLSNEKKKLSHSSDDHFARRLLLLLVFSDLVNWFIYLLSKRCNQH